MDGSEKYVRFLSQKSTCCTFLKSTVLFSLSAAGESVLPLGRRGMLKSRQIQEDMDDMRVCVLSVVIH